MSKKTKIPTNFECLLDVCKFYTKTTDISEKNMKKIRNIIIHHIISDHSIQEILEGIKKLHIELPEAHFSARTVVMCDDNVPADMRPVREIVELLADYMIAEAQKPAPEEED